MFADAELCVKCFGLKWVCLMLIISLPWCQRPWALPFMTILAPSKKYNEARGRAHKTSIDWTILALRIISRWLKCSWVLIGDGGFACVRLGHACIKQNVTLVSRLRLDTALYVFAPSPAEGQRGRHREKGERFISLKKLAADATQPWRNTCINWYGGITKNVRLLSDCQLWYSSGEKSLPIRWVLVVDPDTNEAEAFFSTDMTLVPEQIVNWFVLRWNIGVSRRRTLHLVGESPTEVKRLKPRSSGGIMARKQGDGALQQTYSKEYVQYTRL